MVTLRDLGAIAAAAILAGFILSPSAGRAEQPLILRSADCTWVVTSSIGDDGEEQCGFSGLAMNLAGDRLLTVSMSGRKQLWDREGHSLASVEGADGDSDQLLFAGDRALFLDGHGNLVVLDAATGGERGRFGGMPGYGKLHRMVGDDLLLVSANPSGEYSNRESMVVSIVDGSIRARRMTGPPSMYQSAGPWATGVTTYKDPKGDWRATLHLADAELTQVPLDRWCEPIGPVPQCVRRDVDGRSLYVFDFATRTWTIRDMGVPLIGTTMIEWAQAGGRAFPLICALRPLKSYEHDYDCRIVDMADGRTLHAFVAARRIIAGGLTADGRAEIRIAFQAAASQDSWTVRRVGLDGSAETLGAFPMWRFGLSGPAGLLWIPDPDDPKRLIARGGGGETLARIDADLRVCAGQVVSWHVNLCRASADEARVAGLTEDRRILWGAIERNDGER